MDARTRVATISWVGYLIGYRADAGELAEACRRRGVVSVIDGIQAIGVLDAPLAEIGADVVACGAHKAMLGLNGTGFLYVRDEMLDRLRPLFGGFAARASRPKRPRSASRPTPSATRPATRTISASG